MKNWRYGTVGLLVALALGGIAPTQAFDVRDVQYFRANGYRSCQQCDLIRANLQLVDLSQANLQRANLSQANLEGADLSQANLQRAALLYTDLQGAYLGQANLQGAYLGQANLQGAYLASANLQGANLVPANLEGANLSQANLQGAVLGFTNLRNANLSQANLRNANLLETDLQGAYLVSANLQGANLNEANLRNANLSQADLQDANLSGANLRDANLGRAKVGNAQLSEVDFTGATYAPASPPPNGYVAGILGLASVVILVPGDVIGLIQLRKLLQEAGLPEEREATYAIEHSRTNHLLFANQDYPERGHLRWNEPLALAEGLFRYIAFALPVGYGLYPGRALQVLFAAIVVFGLIYAVALATKTGSLYRVWPAGRIEPRPDGLADKPRLEPLRLQGRLVVALGRGLQFSLLSAFHLGFRELNVGTWLARVQAREYGLQAVGWVRVVAGLQSLLSVYLLAMWVLTYFGRPFG